MERRVLNGIRFFLRNFSTVLATECANGYIDIDEYDLEVVETSLFVGCYFYKTVNGIESWDRIDIVVSKVVGKVESLYCGMLGSFTSSTAGTSSLTDSVSALTSENAVSALEAKLDAIYGEYESYEVTNQVLAKLANGSVGLVSTVNVEFGEGDSYQVTILLCDSSSVTE